MNDKELIRTTYFDKFHCKCGACENCCCRGWTVSISMEEYFRLIGLECSSELRSKLDVAFHLVDDGNRDEFRYAQITPRFDGWCPLHGEDGLCSLQKECGESVLPSVCRLYPRSIRNSDDEEALSNSCEGVVEALISSTEPITFKGISVDATKQSYYAELREKVICLMQDRSFTLAERIEDVGLLLEKIDKVKESEATAIIEKFKHVSQPRYCNDKKRLQVQLAILRWVMDNSETEHTACMKATQNFSYGAKIPHYDSVEKIYDKRKTVLYADFPQIEVWWENILVNHLFFDRFPFSDKRVSFFDEYKSLSATYAFLTALAVGCVDENSTKDKFVSLVASAFRLIEHSKFDYNMSVIMHYLGCNSIKELNNLLNG